MYLIIINQIMTDKVCFIIMPITTPADYIPVYNNDSDHFLHIIDCLFKPAIEKAGFKPILPLTRGSEIIQGEIISNIENSDLVLCDMSILNPNVFFELGIRTALNKPVCLIKDSTVEKVPFDTSIINYHTYCPDLSSWVTKSEIEKLASHIKDSYSKSNNCNSLWKYFSLKSVATPPERINGDNEKIDYLMMQVDAIRNQLKTAEKSIFVPPADTYNYQLEEDVQEKRLNYFLRNLEKLLTIYNIKHEDINMMVNRSSKIVNIEIKNPQTKSEAILNSLIESINNISEICDIKTQISS